jgi:hypothetical protein
VRTVGRRVALAEPEPKDTAGRLYATATSSLSFRVLTCSLDDDPRAAPISDQRPSSSPPFSELHEANGRLTISTSRDRPQLDLHPQRPRIPVTSEQIFRIS